jgi:hypothetical protein
MDYKQYLAEVVWYSDVDKKNLAWGKNKDAHSMLTLCYYYMKYKLTA